MGVWPKIACQGDGPDPCLSTNTDLDRACGFGKLAALALAPNIC